jgi:hypothetical protein
MNDGPVSVRQLATRWSALVDELQALDWSALSAEQVLELLTVKETQERRLLAVEYAAIAELAARGIPQELGCSSTEVMLGELLRITRPEATARVRAAEALGPRRAMTGEVLGPKYPLVAAAVAEGAISAQHACVITRLIDRLPDAVVAEHDSLVGHVEPTMVSYAREFDPAQLGKIAQRVTACLRPDGVLTGERWRERNRELHLQVRSDGSGQLRGELTSEAVAVLRPVLSALSRPVPSEDGIPDQRTAPQRRHDAVIDLCHRVLRSGGLPDAGGVPATLLVTVTLDQLQTRRGVVSTGHGALLNVDTALRLAAEANIVPVVLDDTGGVLAYGLTRRVASAGQRLALAARDGGCSFPGCDRPPDWSESHHVRAWADGGHTDINNLTLVCGFHHREHAKRGWSCRMRHGVPHWIPPAWQDPDQVPRRNTRHHVPITVRADASDAAPG